MEPTGVLRRCARLKAISFRQQAVIRLFSAESDRIDERPGLFSW